MPPNPTDQSENQVLATPLTRGLIRRLDPNLPNSVDDLKPLAISVETFCQITSIKRTSAFALIRDNQLAVRRVGRRTLILMHSVEALLGLGEGDV